MIFSSASPVIIQGLDEPLGLTVAIPMKAYGTNLIAGVAAGYGGQVRAAVPIYDMVEQVVADHGSVQASVICAHPYRVLDAALEAMHAGIRQIVILTQGVPPLDMVKLVRQAEALEALVLGPNTPGIIVPGAAILGLHPAQFYLPGNVGLLSRNGPLTYEIAQAMTAAGMGQSIALSIGSDAILGSTFPQWLRLLNADEQTAAIVLVGEIGGDMEEVAAYYINGNIDKPVVAYIAGHTSPRDRRLGHAGAILESRSVEVGPDLGTAESKVQALKRAGIPVATKPSDVPKLLGRALRVSRQKTA
jgi:succinyl-CoA synthetase alpha subunit